MPGAASIGVARAALRVLVALTLGASAWAGSLPPRYRFKTLEAGRVRVHFHTEVALPARRVAALALEILPRLEERYKVHVPSLDVVVHDASDSPNGLATAFPYSFVEIRTASPDGADSGPTESWLRMVVTHELTHIAHMEQAGGLYGLGRRVFGRAPFLFPNALQPTWFIEGLAVREETRGTAFGRGRHTFTKMVVDEAARAGGLGRIDQATLGLDLWPLGNAAYLFGEEFLRVIEREHGEDAPRDLAASHARSLRPYLDGRTFRETLDIDLAASWRAFARDRAVPLPRDDSPVLLTRRGAIQTSPRLAPDRSQLAYFSRTLDRMGEIRLMNLDGSNDRAITRSLSGRALSWSRDGRFIVFDEADLVDKFEWRSDLHRIDVATGGRTRLTRGLRASDPDVGPATAGSKAPIVFVQRFADRSELSLLAEGGKARTLTSSPPGAEWSHPRFSPEGDGIVASRLLGGFSDLVLVDPSHGEITALLSDRALDAEPSWADDRTIIFRSDREGESFRLYLLGRDGSNLRRAAGLPQNAFGPEVDLERKTVFFAHYSAQGYDLATAPFLEGGAAASYVDPFPPNTEEPPPFEGPERDYRLWPSLRPRFATPFVEVVESEWRLGLATASIDPLQRVAYGLASSWGTRVGKANALGYFRYDRFTPTFSALARIESSPIQGGDGVRDLKEGRVSVDFPLERSGYRTQSLGLTLRRRHESAARVALETGVLAVGWQLDSTRTFPMSISPQDGFRLRVSVTREMKALGSALDFGKAQIDARAYTRVGKTVIVSRVGGGATFGARAPSSAFAVGGLSSPAFLDPAGDEPAVLRGYKTPDGSEVSRYGRRLAFANVDWRIPLGHPQRGFRALPFFLRHLHLTASVDAAVIGARTLNLDRARVGASIGIGADLFLAHRIPVTLQGGLGRGLTRDGVTTPWFSIGFPF